MFLLIQEVTVEKGGFSFIVNRFVLKEDLEAFAGQMKTMWAGLRSRAYDSLFISFNIKKVV